MRLTLRIVRVWLPVSVVLLGVVLFAIDPSENAEGAAGIVGAGLAIWLLNLLFRIGVTGDRERDDEDAARAFFDEHGHWPDEPPPRRRPPETPETPPPRPAPPHRRPDPHRPPRRRRPE